MVFSDAWNLISDSDRSHNKIFVNINTTTIEANNHHWHKKTPFWKKEGWHWLSSKRIDNSWLNNHKCPGSESYLFVPEKMTTTYKNTGYSWVKFLLILTCSECTTSLKWYYRNGEKGTLFIKYLCLRGIGAGKWRKKWKEQ